MPKKSPKGAASTPSTMTPSPELNTGPKILTSEQLDQAHKIWQDVLTQLNKINAADIRACIITMAVKHDDGVAIGDDEEKVQLLSFLCGEAPQLATAAMVVNDRVAGALGNLRDYAEDQAEPHVRH